jgi:hypothetical protein
LDKMLHSAEEQITVYANEQKELQGAHLSATLHMQPNSQADCVKTLALHGQRRGSCSCCTLVCCV